MKKINSKNDFNKFFTCSFFLGTSLSVFEYQKLHSGTDVVESGVTVRLFPIQNTFDTDKFILNVCKSNVGINLKKDISNYEMKNFLSEQEKKELFAKNYFSLPNFGGLSLMLPPRILCKSLKKIFQDGNKENADVELVDLIFEEIKRVSKNITKSLDSNVKEESERHLSFLFEVAMEAGNTLELSSSFAFDVINSGFGFLMTQTKGKDENEIYLEFSFKELCSLLSIVTFLKKKEALIFSVVKNMRERSNISRRTKLEFLRHYPSLFFNNFGIFKLISDLMQLENFKKEFPCDIYFHDENYPVAVFKNNPFSQKKDFEKTLEKLRIIILNNNKVPSIYMKSNLNSSFEKMIGTSFCDLESFINEKEMQNFILMKEKKKITSSILFISENDNPYNIPEDFRDSNFTQFSRNAKIGKWSFSEMMNEIPHEQYSRFQFMKMEKPENKEDFISKIQTNIENFIEKIMINNQKEQKGNLETLKERVLTVVIYKFGHSSTSEVIKIGTQNYHVASIISLLNKLGIQEIKKYSNKGLVIRFILVPHVCRSSLIQRNLEIDTFFPPGVDLALIFPGIGKNYEFSVFGESLFEALICCAGLNSGVFEFGELFEILNKIIKENLSRKEKIILLAKRAIEQFCFEINDAFKKKDTLEKELETKLENLKKEFLKKMNNIEENIPKMIDELSDLEEETINVKSRIKIYEEFAEAELKKQSNNVNKKKFEDNEKMGKNFLFLKIASVYDFNLSKNFENFFNKDEEEKIQQAFFLNGKLKELNETEMDALFLSNQFAISFWEKFFNQFFQKISPELRIISQNESNLRGKSKKTKVLELPFENGERDNKN